MREVAKRRPCHKWGVLPLPAHQAASLTAGCVEGGIERMLSRHRFTFPFRFSHQPRAPADPCSRHRLGAQVRLSAFITGHMDRILAAWDEYARTMSPAADDMSLLALRDHAEEMLRAIALDIETPQTEAQRHDKSLGGSDDARATTAASVHGGVRHDSRFTLVQLNGEFRALRASVLHLWLEHASSDSRQVLADVMRFNEALDQALAESVVTFSARADYARNMFDAILGHDLRGPLSTITMSGELLTRHELRADKAKDLGVRITSAARYMSSLVNDLLEFARLGLGGASLPVHPEIVEVEEICNDALNHARAMHPQCTFELAAGSQARSSACMDADRVHQLLVNLLGNAGQHGAAGRPVRLHIAGDNDVVTLSVVNEGARIPEASLKQIFQPLVRLSSVTDSQGMVAGSLGLGLYIAREIAEAHGGTIAAESDDQHTTFSVRLPRECPAGAACT